MTCRVACGLSKYVGLFKSTAIAIQLIKYFIYPIHPLSLSLPVDL